MPTLTEVERHELLVRGQEELTHVDFATLRNIYEEIMRRSGEDSEKMNFCGLESISIVSDQYFMDIGEYSPDTKTLVVNVAHKDFPHNKSEEKNELDPGLFARVLLSVLIHEETHATGDKLPCHSEEDLDRITEQIAQNGEMSVTGLRAIKMEAGEFSIGFYLLDEAVTDLIGEEVFVEYLKRTGDRVRYTSRKGSSKYARGYSGGRTCVAALILRVAQAAGLPKAIVWNALKQGYYKKSDTTLTDLRTLLGEVLDKTIAEALERVPAKDPEAVDQLLSTLAPKEEDVRELAASLMKLEQSRVIVKEMRQ